jgi:aspartate beta-hydroxylase
MTGKTPPPVWDAATDQRVRHWMALCERALIERRSADADRAFREAHAAAPAHPLVLQESARRALSGGEPRRAEQCLEQAAALAPQEVNLWLSLAQVRRVLAMPERELSAIESALRIDPSHPLALLQKAAVLDLMGRRRAAAKAYGHAVQTINPRQTLPPSIDQMVRTAHRRVAEGAAELGAHIGASLGAGDGDSRAARYRFDRGLDHLLARRPIYTPKPTFLFLPFLVHYEYYARDYFPWMPELESHTAAIRAECLAVLEHPDDPGLEPYVAYPDGVPLEQWSELNRSRRWSAYFFWKEGHRLESHIARCPRTVAALAGVPQVDVPGRAPTAFLSILAPRTHIPPHHGVTNTRLTVHLPLVVPPGCTFRVGGEERHWQEGVAWAFDDTIEHEAHNASDRLRAILLIDIWNPQLTAAEREWVRRATVAVAEFYEAEGTEMELGL